MSKAAPSSGKGDKRRKEDARKVRERWDDIDWSKKPVPPNPLDKKSQS